MVWEILKFDVAKYGDVSCGSLKQKINELAWPSRGCLLLTRPVVREVAAHRHMLNSPNIIK
jgi:hypothetical protein